MPDDLISDLDQLRQEFPAWRFGTTWVTAGNRPDARRIWARRDSILITAWSRAEMAMDIHREEAQ